MSPIKVLILGSCVSRDPFGHPIEDESGFSLVDYYARSSLVSLSGAPNKTGFDLSQITSPFQKKMVQRDVSKAFYQNLGKFEHDVLLIDFIDDRFNVIERSADGSRVTRSPEFLRAKINIPTNEYRYIRSFSDEFYTKWVKGWSLLINNLKEINHCKSILINKVFWAHKDDLGVDLPDQEQIEKANQYLQKVYAHISSEFSDKHFISYSEVEMLSSSSHKWGIAPFHYTHEIEQYCLASIREFHNETN